MNTAEDEDIIQLICNEETVDRGFRLLVNAYGQRIYWQVRRMLVDHEDSNDVCQNIFVKVFQNISKYKGEAALYSWIYRISINECLTFLKKKKRRFSASDDFSSFNLKADAFFDGDAVETLLWTAINLLPERQKAVFQLRYFEDLPYSDIAEIMEVTEGSLKASYHHAAKKIETYIKNNGHGE